MDCIAYWAGRWRTDLASALVIPILLKGIAVQQTVYYPPSHLVNRLIMKKFCLQDLSETYICYIVYLNNLKWV